MEYIILLIIISTLWRWLKDAAQSQKGSRQQTGRGGSRGYVKTNSSGGNSQRANSAGRSEMEERLEQMVRDRQSTQTRQTQRANGRSRSGPRYGSAPDQRLSHENPGKEGLALRVEIAESKRYWAENQAYMDSINADFNGFRLSQHAEHASAMESYRLGHSR